MTLSNDYIYINIHTKQEKVKIYALVTNIILIDYSNKWIFYFCEIAK